MIHLLKPPGRNPSRAANRYPQHFCVTCSDMCRVSYSEFMRLALASSLRTPDTLMETPRRPPRYRTTCLVTFSTPPYGGALLWNVSSHGCLVAGCRLLSEGQPVSLLIHLPGDLPTVSVDMAMVRWINDYRVGLEFVAMLHQERRKLEVYLETIRLRSEPCPEGEWDL